MFRDSLTIRQVIGIMISLCGVLLIIAKGKLSSLLGIDFNRGDIYVFIAANIWATYSSNLKRFPDGLHPLAYLMAIVIVGLIGITPFYVWELFNGKIMAVTTESIITIVYVALFASVLAFIFWNRAVRAIGANKAGPFIHLMPVFSTILAIIFLNEQLTGYHLQGILMIFCGIFLTTFRVHRK
jgi:drug/metabolite transporter (DMT)-like permease